jgi:hypothetical protein
MGTREIQTSQDQLECDVCGRTVLRGERTETYLDGAARREVCELCVARAAHEGWIREESRLDAPPAVGAERRRSVFGRLRQLRERAAEGRSDAAGEAEVHPLPGPAPVRAAAQPAPGLTPRQPRQVHAVPTSPEQKIAAALELFNSSEHPRTVAGVARSLGAPDVAARPGAERPSLVTIVVSWELSWYRYEVELSDDVPVVREVERGDELSELSADDLAANVVVNEHGMLAL